MSSTTSQKFRDFTSEPLKDKDISEVPGIGPKLASNLESSGLTKVCLNNSFKKQNQIILFLFF